MNSSSGLLNYLHSLPFKKKSFGKLSLEPKDLYHISNYQGITFENYRQASEDTERWFLRVKSFVFTLPSKDAMVLLQISIELKIDEINRVKKSAKLPESQWKKMLRNFIQERVN